VAYDLTHNKDYEAEVITNDGKRAVIHVINGHDINITWNDCPEFDTSGRKTGKLLPPSACQDPKGYDGHDASGARWVIDMLPSHSGTE
jgi:hypothetical protein